MEGAPEGAVVVRRVEGAVEGQAAAHDLAGLGALDLDVGGGALLVPDLALAQLPRVVNVVLHPWDRRLPRLK